MERTTAKTGGSTAATDDGRKTYDVKPGVPWIAGERVGKRTEMELSPKAAAYDLQHERLALKGGKRPKSWDAKPQADKKAD
ncbi:hypothetical protein GTW51_19075 [Aurantimonas aggregata]|uniref:Uncharacterized protein n=1 Tax=Aurantimonas aggregata TaxID=2047720 RepID=A0A6L9MM53_9HYPH|nr:hypothetical protein [Aurantimonas aggregata]NDV88801.1 hypothetical protein [Aurantimonas aggregata]